MSHEKSVTVKRGQRFFNIDTVGSDKGRILGPKEGFPTEEAAVSAAKKRSKSFDKKPRTAGGMRLRGSRGGN